MLDRHLIYKTRPNANAGNVIFWKDYRVTVLQDRLFRLEKSKAKNFRDGATQAVWFRDMPKQEFSYEETEKSLIVKTNKVTLVVKENRKDCYVEINGKKIPVSNVGNLKGTARTLDGADGNRFVYDPSFNNTKFVDMGYGVCSKTGVAVYADQRSLTLGEDGLLKTETGNGTDEYVFAYGNDFRGAVKALYMITGETPLVPRFALGNWWSRYHAYTQEEYLRILNKFQEREIPLTVATIDMDWHWSGDVDEQKKITESGKNGKEYVGDRSWAVGWTGYSWNTELFPDYKELLGQIKKRGLTITLNLHPADGVRFWEDQYVEMANAMGVDPESGHMVAFDIANPKFINQYFKILHKPYEKDGVDFWWIDWQQGGAEKWDGIDPLWSLNHYHYADNAVNHTDPLILSRYAGVGSHRYPLGFSGDTFITWKTLAYLPYFTATASNVGYTWWSHDIGGHQQGNKEDELYVRHLQYGVFSPINRLHCTNLQTMTKEPWLYQNGSGLIACEWLKLRHQLIPFLYSASYRTKVYGEALVEPLYYEWDQKEAYEARTEYLFGGQLLVIPVVTKRQKDGYARVSAWLPQGVWTDIFTGDRYEIGKGGKKLVLLRTLDSIPVLVSSGGILPLSKDKGNAAENPERLDICVWRGDGEYTLYEDGRTKQNEEEAFTEFRTENEETSGAGTQRLKIKTICKADGIIPINRKIRVRFKDIPKGETVVLKNGKSVSFEKSSSDCVAVEFPFDRTAEYEITVTYEKENRLAYLKRRARETLIRAEGANELKYAAYTKICKAESLTEYEKTVDESALAETIKLRLKETL